MDTKRELDHLAVLVAAKGCHTFCENFAAVVDDFGGLVVVA